MIFQHAVDWADTMWIEIFALAQLLDNKVIEFLATLKIRASGRENVILHPISQDADILGQFKALFLGLTDTVRNAV